MIGPKKLKYKPENLILKMKEVFRRQDEVG